MLHPKLSFLLYFYIILQSCIKVTNNNYSSDNDLDEPPLLYAVRTRNFINEYSYNWFPQCHPNHQFNRIGFYCEDYGNSMDDSIEYRNKIVEPFAKAAAFYVYRGYDIINPVDFKIKENFPFGFLNSEFTVKVKVNKLFSDSSGKYYNRVTVDFDFDAYDITSK